MKFGYSPNGNPSTTDFQAIATKVGRNVDLPMFYQSFPKEPILYSSQIATCNALNATPSVAYEPTVTLGSLVNGSQDTALKNAAAVVKSFAKPVVVRFAFEFNGNWMAYGNGKETPSSYTAGWVYAVETFRAAGATNAEFVWNANIWGQSASTVDPAPFYPGDEWVDWIALDGYMNLKSPVYSFSDLFLVNYQELATLSTKPFMIGEVGCAGDARLSKAAWFAGMFLTIATEMPDCEALQYWGRVMTNGEGDYSPDTSGTDSQALATFQTGLTLPYFTT